VLSLIGRGEKSPGKNGSPLSLTKLTTTSTILHLEKRFSYENICILISKETTAILLVHCPGLDCEKRPNVTDLVPAVKMLVLVAGLVSHIKLCVAGLVSPIKIPDAGLVLPLVASLVVAGLVVGELAFRQPDMSPS